MSFEYIYKKISIKIVSFISKFFCHFFLNFFILKICEFNFYVDSKLMGIVDEL